MPTLLREAEIKIDWSDIEAMAPKAQYYSGPRSSGVHLSGIIKHILQAAGLLTADEVTEEMPLRMWLGMAFEAYAVRLWPEMVWQPGECSKDGITGSPDGITPKGDSGLLEEFKLTWLSRLEKSEIRGVAPPARRITDQRRWMLQLAGYLYMLGLTEARLHVCWVMGDYRGSGPQYFTYHLLFTQEELRRTWDNMILKNRDGAKAEEH